MRCKYIWNVFCVYSVYSYNIFCRYERCIQIYGCVAILWRVLFDCDSNLSHIERKSTMTILDNDEMIDLGAISVETRGIKQLGEPDFEDGDHYGLVGAISTDD